VSLSRWLPFSAIAVAVHVAAAFAMRIPVRASAPASTLEPASQGEFDLEQAPPVESTPPSPVAAMPQSVLDESAAASRGAPGRPGRLGGAVAAREANREPAEGGSPNGSEVSQGPPAQTSEGGWTFDPRARVPGAADWTDPGAVAMAASEGGGETQPAVTGISQTGGLVEGLDARDASIGLGRGGGAVVSALEVAAGTDATAVEGKATFDIAIDTSGKVSVVLVNASQSAAEWSRVGEATRASLDPRRIRIPPGATGWHVMATVEAKVQYPNGADPKKMGTHVEAVAVPKLVENKRRANVADPPIVFKGPPPGITLTHAGKVCSVRVYVGLGLNIDGGCDPSNIGTNTVRLVHGHVVSEGRL
jgi:hypothetical protein